MKYQMVAGFVHFVENMIFNKKLIPVNLINCDPPREKIPLGAILNYSVWCRKVNLRVLCQKPVLYTKQL